ncbi:hypothetical protein Q3G72_034845 [Acer saccharum]|nr:hypothetical protein Q3G72_034845 [Acer saccharum]
MSNTKLLSSEKALKRASRAIDWGVVGAYQAQLFLRKDVKSLSKKVSSLTSSNAKIKKDLEGARSAEASAKEAMKGAVEKWKKLKALDDDEEGEDGEEGTESKEQIDTVVEGKVSEDN